MKIRYDREADVLLLILKDAPPVDSIEDPGGIIVSYGENNEPLSVEFLNASARKWIVPGETSIPIQRNKAPVLKMRG
jgi:uncharacterized protein YuzE